MKLPITLIVTLTVATGRQQAFEAYERRAR